MAFTEARPLPPGQVLVEELPVRHYGSAPVIARPDWTLRLTGATADGQSCTLDWAGLLALGRTEVIADIHCTSRKTAQDLRWGGILARDVVALCPPAPGAEEVLVSAQHGYSASVRLADLMSPRALFATHLDGRELSVERGGPVRLVVPHLYGFKGPKWVREVSFSPHPVRGFWEQRGYHLRGDAWRQERYSYQE